MIVDCPVCGGHSLRIPRFNLIHNDCGGKVEEKDGRLRCGGCNRFVSKDSVEKKPILKGRYWCYDCQEWIKWGEFVKDIPIALPRKKKTLTERVKDTYLGSKIELSV